MKKFLEVINFCEGLLAEPTGERREWSSFGEFVRFLKIVFQTLPPHSAAACVPASANELAITATFIKERERGREGERQSECPSDLSE